MMSTANTDLIISSPDVALIISKYLKDAFVNPKILKICFDIKKVCFLFRTNFLISFISTIDIKDLYMLVVSGDGVIDLSCIIKVFCKNFRELEKLPQSRQLISAILSVLELVRVHLKYRTNSK